MVSVHFSPLEPLHGSQGLLLSGLLLLLCCSISCCCCFVGKAAKHSCWHWLLLHCYVLLHGCIVVIITQVYLLRVLCSRTNITYKVQLDEAHAT